MRIVVLHDEVTRDASPDELDNLVQAKEVRRVLLELGYNVSTFSFTMDLKSTREELGRIAPDVVFNLVETVGGSDRLVHLATSLLESLRIPFTGCPANGVYQTTNKLLSKQILRMNDINTPDWLALDGGARIWDCGGRWIIKSIWEHASIGMDGSAVFDCSDEETLHRAVQEKEDAMGGGQFAERYIEGREFNVSVFERDGITYVLPAAEMCFVDWPSDKPRIVDYRAKWEEESFEYRNTVRHFPGSPEDKDLTAKLSAISLRCWDLFGLRGYARVDFRVDERGTPFVLEINTNPCIAADAGFMAAASIAGISFEQVISDILNSAFARRRPVHPITASVSGDTEFRMVPRMDDRGALENLVKNAGVFSSSEIAIALELFDEFSVKGVRSGYRFVFCDIDGELAGYACYGEIPGTQSSFDLYWIVVGSRFKRQGLGQRLLAKVERETGALMGTHMYVDTSGRAAYLPAQSFYEAAGYRRESVLHNFYGPDDDKFIYSKKLAPDKGGSQRPRLKIHH